MHFRIGKRALGLAAVAAALLAPSAAAAPVVDGEFPVSSIGSNNKITLGPDFNMWVTLSSGGKSVAKITPAGAVTEYDLEAGGTAQGIASDGKSLWITRNGGVTSFDPADPENSKDPTGIGTIAGNHSIVLGPDGNLWVATSEKLIRIPPGNPAEKKEFTVAGLSPRDIDTAGSLLAIADFGEGRVVTATTDDPPITKDLKLGGGSQGVAGTPGSGLIAFTQPTAAPKEIGVFTPPGSPLITNLADDDDPFGIVYATDGAYWAAESNHDRLVRITSDNQVTFLAGFAAGSKPRQITYGPGNTLWVTLETAKKIGRVSGVDPPVVPTGPTGPPETKIDKGPKGKVKTKKKKAKVKFRFSSPAAGATFECRMVKKPKKGKKAPKKPAFKGCKSPKTYKLKPGKYRFEVRAVLGGVKDATPAKRSFRVVRVSKG